MKKKVIFNIISLIIGLFCCIDQLINLFPSLLPEDMYGPFLLISFFPVLVGCVLLTYMQKHDLMITREDIKVNPKLKTLLLLLNVFCVMFFTLLGVKLLTR